jgi:hypothetical protein
MPWNGHQALISVTINGFSLILLRASKLVHLYSYLDRQVERPRTLPLPVPSIRGITENTKSLTDIEQLLPWQMVK